MTGKENTLGIKNTLKILNRGTNSTKKQQQEYFDRKKEYFRQKQPKKYKNIIYEEESDSEPEVEESQYIPEEKEEIKESFFWKDCISLQ